MVAMLVDPLVAVWAVMLVDQLAVMWVGWLVVLLVDLSVVHLV